MWTMKGNSRWNQESLLLCICTGGWSLGSQQRRWHTCCYSLRSLVWFCCNYSFVLVIIQQNQFTFLMREAGQDGLCLMGKERWDGLHIARVFRFFAFHLYSATEGLSLVSFCIWKTVMIQAQPLVKLGTGNKVRAIGSAWGWVAPVKVQSGCVLEIVRLPMSICCQLCH